MIKRETSLSSDLAEFATSSALDEKQTWFLLFPTKQHWKENTKMEYIISGMQWVRDHCKKWGMESLALPSLGCGLGGLQWKDAGPIICTIADQMKINVVVYLPADRQESQKYLTKEFLIRNNIK